MKTYKSVDDYIDTSNEWKNLLIELRQIILSTGLDETVKWGAPVYIYNYKNIVGLGSFKNFVSIWFFNGLFLKDKKKTLINAQEGKTKALRQWRFTEISEITSSIELIKQYIFEAIEVEKQGKSLKPEKSKKSTIPVEIKKELNSSTKLKIAFEKFSQSKQNEFLEYIIEAKREQTKQNRFDKIIPMILRGEGLNDKYK